MKNSISHILSFILMILIILTVCFVVGEKELRAKYIFKNLENINYYEKSYASILSHIDDYIVNSEVKELYDEYFTINIVKSDIRKIVNKVAKDENYTITRYNDLYKIINSYLDDPEINMKYADGINDLYVKNLFPSREYSLIHKLYAKSTDVLFVAIASSIGVLAISLLLFVINKNFKFHIISLMSAGIVFLLPLLFLEIFGIFDNFIYTNKYYTEFLLSIVNNFSYSLFITGLVIFIMLITYKLIKEKLKLSC